MRILFPLMLVLAASACTRNQLPGDPWAPGALTLIDPDSREATAARLESEPWPVGGAKASAVALLSNWIRWRGIHTPLPFFKRLAAELGSAQRRKLWLDALDSYPGARPYPPREDPTAAWILKDLGTMDPNDPAARRELLQRMHDLVGRLGPLGDPRHVVRTAVADLLADLGPSGEVTELFSHLLEPGVPGALRARAMLSLGIAGFNTPKLLPDLFNGLHSVQDHINLAPFALTALSGARGAARELVSRAVAQVLAPGLVLEVGFPKGASGQLLPEGLREALDAWARSTAALQDPSLVQRTSARVLVALGEEWTIRLLINGKYHLAGQPPDFAPDETFLAVREILLTGVPRSRALLAEEAAGLAFGQELSSRAIAVSRVVWTCHPDLVGLLQRTRGNASVHLTTMDWIAQFRDAALKAALARPELADELTKLWNSQDTEEGQWRQTAHLWMPLVTVPGERKDAAGAGDAASPCDEADSFGGMSPDEWLRTKLRMTLWICSADDGSVPGPGPVGPAPVETAAPKLAEWELAWSAQRENARAARAAACQESRLRSLRDWERRTLAGCADFECLWALVVREGEQWPPEAREKALRLLTTRFDVRQSQGLATRFAAVPMNLAIHLLEWFEPMLSPNVRAELRDRLRSESCIQDEACLPVLMQAVQLANRREVRSENVPGQ